MNAVVAKPVAVGRKWFDGKDEQVIVSQLKEAWAAGCLDTEAAVWAGISNKSLSRYLKAFPEKRELRDDLKSRPTMQARRNVAKKITAGDTDTSKWYLERKAKGEFSLQTKIDHSTMGEKLETKIIINLQGEELDIHLKGLVKGDL